MSTATLDPAVARYVERFDPPRDALYERRVAAFERFKTLGFPGPRDEAWRQTPLRGVLSTDWKPAPSPDGTWDPLTSRLPRFGAGRPARVVALVNGHVPPHSLGGPLERPPEWFTVADGEPAAATPCAERLDALLADHPFAALNLAFFPTGILLDIPPGAHAETPLTLLFLRTHERFAADHHSRVVVRVGAGASCSILEAHDPMLPAGAPTFSTHVTELLLGDGAQVEHTVWQQLGPQSHHVAITQAELGRDARLRCHGFTDGGALTRNEVRARFTAPGGEADFHGLMLGRGTDLVDYHTLVEHATTDSASRQTYKGILAERAKAVFEGQVRIRPGAQRTNATQSVKHLLLSDGALAHAKPVLEILADDVKCAHGAAIGQLDEAALFYLRSRGLPFADARRLLVEAYADDLVGRIGDAAVREWLTPRVREALPLGAP